MHFFIDHNQLPQQAFSDMKFGPNISDPQNAFNLTTQFQLTVDAKAFACQSGMMVVRKNDYDPDNLVNFYIKLDKHVEIEGVAVLVDGIPFDKTSDAMKIIFGNYLKGDNR